MPRLYINYRISSVLWVIGSLVVGAAIIGVGIYATTFVAVAALPTFFMFLLPLIFLIVSPRTLLRQDRTIRGAGSGDNRVAPLVIAQPNPAEAMAPGATLQMTRTTPRGAIVRAGSSVLISSVFMILFTEFLVAIAFSTVLSNSPLNEGSGNPPGWLVWFFVLAPLVLWGGYVVSFYSVIARQGQLTISADDQGITLKQSLCRPRFMPWDDIHVWIRGTGNSSDAYLSTYGLVGYRHRLFLEFNSAFNLRMARAKPSLAITYVGGSEYYQAQARQLLATIAARSKVTLHTFPQGFYGPSLRRSLPFAQLTTTDIAALPVAHPALLPSLPAVQAMQTYPGPLALQLSLRQRSRLPVALFIVFGIIGVITLVNVFFELAIGNAMTAALNILPLFLIGALLLLRFRFSINPSISADAQGIRGSTLNRPITIPWQSVRNWVVEPPAANHPHDSIYGVFSDGPTLTWRVPVSMGNDPQSIAQRANVEAFHAMIAARTGQPARQLPVR